MEAETILTSFSLTWDTLHNPDEAELFLFQMRPLFCDYFLRLNKANNIVSYLDELQVTVKLYKIILWIS